jgi:hypothetical protein
VPQVAKGGRKVLLFLLAVGEGVASVLCMAQMEMVSESSAQRPPLVDRKSEQ